jgi:hypothetical protein
VGSKSEWSETRISFELEPNGEYTGVRFRHAGWKSEDGSFAHCSTKWAIFLVSLKKLVESGKGTPFPSETKIDEHN